MNRLKKKSQFFLQRNSTEYLSEPWTYMNHDLKATAQPYKSRAYIWRDALQPFYGLKNAFKAVGLALDASFNLINLILIFFLVRPLYSIIASDKAQSFEIGGFKPFKYAKYGLLGAFGLLALNVIMQFLGAAFMLLRAVTQIIFAPLTWLVRIPLRLFLTKKHGSPDIETNKGLANVVTQLDNALYPTTMDPNNKNVPTESDLDNMTATIFEKFTASAKKGQATKINKESHDALYKAYSDGPREQKIQARKNYLSLFKKHEEAPTIVIQEIPTTPSPI